MIPVARLAPLALALGCDRRACRRAGSATRTRVAAADLTTARAFAVQVAVPGQAGASAASVSAPPDAVGVRRLVRLPLGRLRRQRGLGHLRAPSRTRARGDGDASAEISTISIFGGDVTVGTSPPRQGPRRARRSLGGGLRRLGRDRPRHPGPGGRCPAPARRSRSATGARSSRSSGPDLARHERLARHARIRDGPAGRAHGRPLRLSRRNLVMIGYAEASARRPRDRAEAAANAQAAASKPPPRQTKRAKKHKTGARRASAPRSRA